RIKRPARPWVCLPRSVQAKKGGGAAPRGCLTEACLQRLVADTEARFLTDYGAPVTPDRLRQHGEAQGTLQPDSSFARSVVAQAVIPIRGDFAEGR
ncbi:MAG: hypothetical protein WCA12_13975, partial [Burkholderiales bacterium]